MNCARCSMKSDGRTKNSLVLSVIREIQNLGSSIQNLFLTPGRRIVARGAKSLLSSFFICARTDLFLGRLRAPPDGFNNPPDTRNRPGERFLSEPDWRALNGESSTGLANKTPKGFRVQQSRNGFLCLPTNQSTR